MPADPTYVKNAVDQLTTFVNGADRDQLEMFAKCMMNEHRTLQQQVFALFTLCVREWAVCANFSRFDGHNEYTVHLSRQIWEDILKERGVGAPLV